jgi:hypothetical protein
MKWDYGRTGAGGAKANRVAAFGLVVLFQIKGDKRSK